MLGERGTPDEILHRNLDFVGCKCARLEFADPGRDCRGADGLGQIRVAPGVQHLHTDSLIFGVDGIRDSPVRLGLILVHQHRSVLVHPAEFVGRHPPVTINAAPPLARAA